jgi:hypothetical protein
MSSHTEKKFSVELTGNNLYAIRDALMRAQSSGVYPGCYGLLDTIEVIDTVIRRNEERVRHEKDREAKVKALTLAVHGITNTYMDARARSLDSLNAAGWDLVRMEDK